MECIITWKQLTYYCDEQKAWLFSSLNLLFDHCLAEMLGPKCKCFDETIDKFGIFHANQTHMCLDQYQN